jgi:hypothetical protein
MTGDDKSQAAGVQDVVELVRRLCAALVTVEAFPPTPIFYFLGATLLMQPEAVISARSLRIQ